MAPTRNRSAAPTTATTAACAIGPMIDPWRSSARSGDAYRARWRLLEAPAGAEAAARIPDLARPPICPGSLVAIAGHRTGDARGRTVDSPP